MNTPQVSVIMSVYNGSKYVGKAITSILSQTFEDFEFIIVDDASSDTTLEIINSFHDQRVRLIRNLTNQGLAISLNRAIELSVGKYLARQDADDLSDTSRLEKQVLFLEKNPGIAVLGTTTRWIDDQGNILLTWNQPTDTFDIQESLSSYCCLVHGSVMCRSDAIKNLGGYDPMLRTAQDYDLWLRVSESYGLASLPDVLYSYRRHTGMVSVQRETEQSSFADEALWRALERREQYGFCLVGLKRGIPLPLQSAMNHKQLSQLYTRWSAGARKIDKLAAFKLLTIAFLLDPFSTPAWKYLQGIISRKMGHLFSS